MEESLERLATDYIDLYQLHDPPEDVLRRGEVYETLEKLKSEGKIRSYGVALARERHLAILARIPFAQGLLTNSGKETKADYLERDSKALRLRKERAQRFHFLVMEHRTMAQAALQFVLGLEGVTAAILGVSSRKHLRENLGALTAPPLTPKEQAQISQIAKQGPVR